LNRRIKSIQIQNFMKKIAFLLYISLSLFACVPKKKFQEFEAKYANLEAMEKEGSTKLAQTKAALDACNEERATLNKEVDEARQTNRKLIVQVTEMSSLSTEQSRNMQEALSKMKEKDLQIRALNEAINRRDSMTIALVTELKKALGRDNQDIEVQVDKAVVMISISEKVLFKTGEFNIRTDNPQANRQIAAIAAVLKDRPTFDVLIEGHTDNVPFKKDILEDNFDLSVKRATALTRILIEKHGINGAKLIPAGRGEFLPLVANDTPENRAKNRRIRVIVMPNLEEFYGMIGQGMKGGK
jgi:chemotaxis protein MotB